MKTIVNISKKAEEYLNSIGERELWDLVDSIENSRTLVVGEPLCARGYVSQGVYNVFIELESEGEVEHSCVNWNYGINVTVDY